MTQFKKVLVMGSSGVGKKTWARNLTGQSFEPRYLPLENISQYLVNHNNITFNISIIPGQQMIYSVTQPDYVLIFVDVTSKLSNNKAMQWKQIIDNLGICVHLVYTKTDIQGYNNKFNQMVQGIPCSTYSLISGMKGTNVHLPLIKCLQLY